MSHLVNGYLLVSLLLSQFPLSYLVDTKQCLVRVSLQPSAVFVSWPSVTQLNFECVYFPPLVVAPLGCHPIGEASLRTRGTRGLPESGMPHCSYLIHQIRWSRCNIHRVTKTQNVRLSRTIGNMEKPLLKQNYADQLCFRKKQLVCAWFLSEQSTQTKHLCNLKLMHNDSNKQSMKPSDSVNFLKKEKSGEQEPSWLWSHVQLVHCPPISC